MGNITALATCAREIFAFARDKGRAALSRMLLPFDH